MKISAKSRYALAALIKIGLGGDEKSVAILYLSENLGVSKIYLEQVFSLLKRGNIVVSTKGAGGGYQLSRPMHEITVYDILLAIEIPLFEKTAETVADKAPNIEFTLQSEVFKKLDVIIPETLKKITLGSLVTKAEQHGNDGGMYYI
ncbi:MAG: Rrf2 family transcriptional regulator [Oscillospiraceae bacterium]|nr:Rrf2 family transcriptional regulator [Oscillospiraceae bacterium]